MPLRILWSSNAPWVPSGYGQQTKLTVNRLRQAGHNVGLLAWCGLEAARINIDGIPVYPKGAHPYGVDVLGADSQDFKADIAITLIDAWVYDPKMFQGVRWVPYFPVDSEPMAPNVRDAVAQAYDRIVYSKFACAECDKAGLSYHYVPHMIDTNVFTISEQHRQAWRKSIGVGPTDFVAGMVAANNGYPSRKAFPQVLEAFARFLTHHPTAKLYLHTLPFAPGPGGSTDIPAHANHLSREYGVDVGKALVWSHPYQMRLGIPPDYLRDVYNGLDVLLSPSMGEGFGIPIMEAQSCGCPVIVGDWTSMSELFIDGVKIPKDQSERFWVSGYNTYHYLVHVDAVEEALESVASRTFDREQIRQGALPYDCDTVIRDYWLPVLSEIETHIHQGHGELRLVKF